MAEAESGRRIVIAHPNGEAYAVTETTLREVYAQRGFVGKTWQDTGEEYQPSKAVQKATVPAAVGADAGEGG